MFVICALAYQQGDLNRLVYGVDSWGFSCGSRVSAGNITIDLTSNTKLYYLNPLELMSLTNIPYAKTVCTSTCPSSATCGLTSSDFPCNNAQAFICPYYALAPSGLYGALPGVAANSINWYANLTQMSSRIDSTANSVISTLQTINIPWLSTYLSTYLSQPPSGPQSISGRYYQLSSQIMKGPCWPVYVPTTNLFQRCFPAFTSNFTASLVSVANSVSNLVSDSAKNTLTSSWNDYSNKVSRYIGDISKGILIIVVAGLIGGLVLSVLWLVILRYMAGFMAWFTIIMINLLLIGFTLYCFSMAGMLGNNFFSQTLSSAIASYTPEVDPTFVTTTDWKYVAIASAVIAGIIFIITLLMISRIRVAVACIKVASQAVGEMPSILFYPLLPFVLLVGLVVYWVAVSAMLYSAGTLTATCRDPSAKQSFSLSSLSNITTSSVLFPSSSSTTVTCYPNITGNDLQVACGNDSNCYLTYSWNNQIRYAFIYHFFGLLWTSQFIIGISCVTIAGAIGQFYWAAGDHASMSNFPVLVSMKNTFVYHLGSIAFGSLIMAIIMFIRFVLEYLDKKTRNLQESNKLAAWLMSCAKCCAWCLQKIVQFINKNAYIMVGLKGTSYCISAGRAIALLIMNAMRLITVNIIGDILLTLGKLSVAVGCGLIAFGLSDLPYYRDKNTYPETTLSSPIFPVALSIIIGFFCAEIFFSVYDMAIDTILLAFCEDCERHDGVPKWAPPLLMEAMGEKPVEHQHGDQAHGDQVHGVHGAPPPPPPPPRTPTKNKVQPIHG